MSTPANPSLELINLNKPTAQITCEVRGIVRYENTLGKTLATVHSNKMGQLVRRLGRDHSIKNEIILWSYLGWLERAVRWLGRWPGIPSGELDTCDVYLTNVHHFTDQNDWHWEKRMMLMEGISKWLWISGRRSGSDQCLPLCWLGLGDHHHRPGTNETMSPTGPYLLPIVISCHRKSEHATKIGSGPKQAKKEKNVVVANKQKTV